MIDDGTVSLKERKGFSMIHETSHLLEDIEGPLMDLFDLALLKDSELAPL